MTTTPRPTEIEALRDAVEMAWGIIANAGGGEWSNETSAWQEAAKRWRDESLPLIWRESSLPRGGEGEDARRLVPETLIGAAMHLARKHGATETHRALAEIMGVDGAA